MGAQSGSHEVARFDVTHQTFHIVDVHAARALGQGTVPGGGGATARAYRISDIDIGNGPDQPPIRVTIVARGVKSSYVSALSGPADWLEPQEAAQRIGEAVLDLERTAARPPRPIEVEFKGAAALDATDGALIKRVAEGLDRDIDVVIPDELAGG